MFRGLLLAGLLCTLLPTLAVAGIDLQKVKDDFKPVSGYLVMPVGDEFLVDLDAASGVRSGDLLSVVVPGEKIFHPVTKEVLGTLDQVKGFLQVTRVKSGYSYARVLSGAAELKAADVVKRYEQTPALFWDYSGEGEPFYNELAAALPHLDWWSYDQAARTRPETPQALSAGQVALLFIYDQHGLAVKNAGLESLGSYGVARTVAAGVAPVGQLPTSGITPQARPAGGFMPAGAVTPMQTGQPSRGIIRTSDQAYAGIWHSPNLQGSAVGVEVGDFDGDGQLEIASLLNDRLLISRVVNGNLAQVAQLEFPKGLSALHLDGADLTGDGRMELYVTMAQDLIIASKVVEFQAGRYQVTIDDVPWYFNMVQMAEEGPVLLAQKSDYTGQKDYVGTPFRVARRGAKLVEDGTVAVPKPFILYGQMPFNDASGVRRYAALTETDELVVAMPDGKRLWESNRKYGGSSAGIDRPVNIHARDAEGDRTQWLRSRIMLSPNGEVLVPVNEGTRRFAQWRSFKSSYMAALTWNGHVMQERWRTIDQNGYLADFRLADADNDGVDELVTFMGYNEGGFLTTAKSGLVIYEMQ
jgi:hypothetical protein